MAQQATIDSRPSVSKSDERVQRLTFLQRALGKPSSGALLGVIIVSVLFLLIAHSSMFSTRGVLNWVVVSAQLSILAVGACLLIVSGEFDLSMGSMIAFSGILMGLLIVFGEFAPWLAIVICFVGTLSIGLLIGLIRVRTGLPSFIVTLAFLFILRGASIVVARAFNETTLISGMRDAKDHDWLAFLFGGEIFGGLIHWMAENGLMTRLPNGNPVISGIPMVVVWAIVIAVVAGYVLNFTRFGNWIFATGGDANAARSAGIPVDGVRIRLFMLSAFCATVFAATQVFTFGSADASRGLLKEFEAIIAVVIGGAILSGGYGSVVGTVLGAVIFGLVSQGFFYTGVDGDWFHIFLGAVLLGAVAFNTYTRKRVTGGI